jgi:hypothetical protein
MSARGMPAIKRLGNGINELVKYDDSTGMAMVISTAAGAAPAASLPSQANLNCSNITGANIRCLEYQYDQFSNLVQQNKHLFPVVNGALATQQATAEEFYAYDDLQRLTNESRFYLGFSASGSLGESYSYDKVATFSPRATSAITPTVVAPPTGRRRTATPARMQWRAWRAARSLGSTLMT